MSIRRRILTPMLVLFGLSVASVCWISYSAFRTHAESSLIASHALTTFQYATETRERFRQANDVVKAVTDMTMVLDPFDTVAEFRNRANLLRDSLRALEAHALDDEMAKAVRSLASVEGAWRQDAEIVIGATRSNIVPTRYRMDRHSAFMAEQVATVADMAHAKAGLQTASSADGFRSEMTIVVSTLFAATLIVGLFALRRTNGLSRALSRLSGSMRRLADGELDTKISDFARRDEIGDMARSVTAFAKGLRELMTTKQRVEHMALHDPLTSLPNRRYLGEFMQTMLAQAARYGHTVGVCHIDLDKFKAVNDTLGHAAGDAVLVQATNIMRSEVRKSDFIARVGGDEFVVVDSKVRDAAGIAKLSARIIERLSQPFHYESNTCQIGGSIGIALAEGADTDAERLLTNADIALYEAKNLGRGQFRFYNEKMRTEFETRERLVKEIQAGLENDEFIPYFQPQVSARTGALLGFEALARWVHPENGVLGPFAFLEAAEDANLLDDLGYAVMKKAFAAMRGWLDEGLDVQQVGVNFADRQLSNPEFVRLIKDAARENGLQPNQIAVEVLETVLVEEDQGQIVQNINELARIGFQIDLDDFGTGHASISNLKKFHVSCIKIDRAFVTAIDVDEDQQKISGAMINLAKSLGMESLAEGVETKEEFIKLFALGCDYVQGYYIARPMPLEDTTEWLRALSTDDASEGGRSAVPLVEHTELAASPQS
jgi:diguanylate cyclase (GGDEF)-like protein